MVVQIGVIWCIVVKALCDELAADLFYCHFMWSIYLGKVMPTSIEREENRQGESEVWGWEGAKKKRLKLRWWDNVSEVPSSEPFIDAGLPVCGARETLR